MSCSTFWGGGGFDTDKSSAPKPPEQTMQWHPGNELTSARFVQVKRVAINSAVNCLEKGLGGVKEAPLRWSNYPSQGRHSPQKFSFVVDSFSLFAIVLCQSVSMSTGRHNEDPPLRGGLLFSTLSLLQGRFGAASTPIGGMTMTRSESFVLLLLSLMGGSYVLLGGFPAMMFSGTNGGGATIVESPSL
jgi:hypothetical protein